MVYVRRRESAQESSEARADDANTTPTSSSEAGSPLDWMLAALAPTAVVLPASDACLSARGGGGGGEILIASLLPSAGTNSSLSLSSIGGRMSSSSMAAAVPRQGVLTLN